MIYADSFYGRCSKDYSPPFTKGRKGTCRECGRFVKVAKAIILPMITLSTTFEKCCLSGILSTKGFSKLRKTKTVKLTISKAPFFQKLVVNPKTLIFNITKCFVVNNIECEYCVKFS